MTLCHLDHTMYMLGYVRSEVRVYFIDDGKNVVSFRVLQSVLQFQTAMVSASLHLLHLIVVKV